jgi:hypothetical protein
LLEDIAFQFVNQSESALQLIGIGLLVFGAIIAAIVTWSKMEIARAPYFAYSGLIGFAVSAAQIVWVQGIPAMAGGYLWVLMVVSLAAFIVGGFFFGRIAIARSRDCYGSKRMAILAFIPIANLLLLLKPSRIPVSANRVQTIPLLSGGFGVLTGFMLLAASVGVTAYIEEQVRNMAQRVETEPATQQAAIVFMIRSNGLEKTLQLLSAEVPTPITIDQATTLARIEAEGTQLRRTYIVDLEGWTMTDEFRVYSRNGVCALSAFEPILRAGGSIREVYVERGGREIGANIVTRDDCGF